MGEGRRDQHREGNASHEIPLVAGGYGYFTDGSFQGEHGPNPILIAEDWSNGAVISEVVPAKGRNPYAIEIFTRWNNWTGHPEIKLRSDGKIPFEP